MDGGPNHVLVEWNVFKTTVVEVVNALILSMQKIHSKRAFGVLLSRW